MTLTVLLNIIFLLLLTTGIITYLIWVGKSILKLKRHVHNIKEHSIQSVYREIRNVEDMLGDLVEKVEDKNESDRKDHREEVEDIFDNFQDQIDMLQQTLTNKSKK